MERYYVGCDKKGNESYNTNNNNERKEITGLTRITKKRLKELCKKDKLYQTPALNDVLYLHYQGIDCIECLEEYTGLKCLWLECNAISEIQGLDNQKELKCLFLQSNLIKRIENLENCPALDTLNLASNHIRKIENCGFDVLPVLSTLNLSSNFLKDFDGLKDLENCQTLSVLDLSNNRIDDILVVKIFAKMPQLRVLVLQGNPVVSKLPQYRKTLILECKELTYLDSRPVLPKDRACAEAWKAGGYEGERKENARWNRMERKKIRDSVNATIRMRNKHKPPDQRDALFNSSDSEEDTAESKRQRQAEVDAGINMELGIWEEVVNEDSKSETSSDMNISSSTSGLSTTDSNPNVSGDSKSMELHANQYKEEEKVVNNSPDTKAQLLDVERDGNMGEILRVVETEATEVVTKETETKEVNKGQKRVFIEEIPNVGDAENKNTDIASRLVESLLDDEIITAVVEKALPLERHLSAHNLSDSDEATKDEYNATVDAICKITMNDLSIPSPKKRIKLQIEVDESLEEEDEVEEELQTPDELMVLNGKEVEVSHKTTGEILVSSEKTAEQIKYEQECDEVNQKVVEDFEELSTHMDNFFEEMQQDVDGLNKTEPKHNMSSQQESDAESADSSHAELKDHGGKQQPLQREPTPERPGAIVVDQVEQVQGLVASDGSNSSSSGSDVPPEASSLVKVGLPEFKEETPKVEAMSNDVPGDHADLPTQDDNFEKADVGNEKVVVDLKQAQDQTNTSYEREERALRQLLQKLEDENEQLYNLNSAYRRVLEEDIREEIKYQDKEKSDDSSVEICEEIIKELIDELPPKKPKSFEFGAIESDDEYSYSDPPKPAEPPVRTIRDVLGSFNELLQDIARKNREEEAHRERDGTEALQRKHATTEAEKTASLHKLLSSPNLRDFNGDTSESLDQQIAAEKKRETQRVRKLVDRVYAQKDKYNDTLDVVDGKLVVVKKDTGEIEDLPESKLNYSDSEGSDAYESANSDNEEGATVSTRLWDAKVRREESVGDFKLPYRPTERISAMRLIQKANALKEKEDAEREAEEEAQEEEDNEKFYSLEPNKPVTFRNIDEEFIEKLDFEKAALEKEEEADEALECARSYTELKQMVKEKKEEGLNLTDDENVMLQKMLGRAEKDGETNQPVTDPLTAEENELLHKMVQRTKEKEKEKQEAQRSEADMRERNVQPTLSMQTLKILEFNDNNSSTSGVEDEEKAANFMSIKNLNAQFPIPHAFRDMLDDYDLGTMAPHLPAAEPELTVLYRKENKNHTEERDEREVLVCGNFEEPLHLSRGGVEYATYEGDDEEDEFKELDTSYDDVLPTSENEMTCEAMQDSREASQLKVKSSALHVAATDTVHEQNCERLSVVAANLLKFDGSNYEDYGIDKETARGVVEYEKMLNFGYEEEDEFVDAPMQEEELVKIVKEALQKDEQKEDENDYAMRSEKEIRTKPGLEKSEHKSRVDRDPNEPLERSTSDESAASKTEITEEHMEILDVEDIKVQDATGLNDRAEEGQFIGKDETVGSKSAILAELDNKAEHGEIDFEKINEEIMQELQSNGKPRKFKAQAQIVMEETEFQDLSEEYKDFPVVSSSSSETIDAANEATESQVEGENASTIDALPKLSTTINESHAPSEEYKDIPMLGKCSTETTNADTIDVSTSSQSLKVTNHSTASPTAPQHSPKRTPTALEKRRSLQNLLKSPILKRFNDDTNESLDAQIQAAQEDDFNVIECSLQVIGDNDEVVNDISVNAEITYRA